MTASVNAKPVRERQSARLFGDDPDWENEVNGFGRNDLGHKKFAPGGISIIMDAMADQQV
jgi:hypothetical protein